MAKRATHGMEAYNSHMAQRGRHERRQLQPGDRLADGSIWTGDSVTTNLQRRRELLVEQMAEIRAEIEKIDEELGMIESDDEESTVEVSGEQPVEEIEEVVEETSSAEVPEAAPAEPEVKQEVEAAQIEPEEAEATPPAEPAKKPKGARGRSKSDK